jgi:multisubunit Na+/H+ antiporter MnhC subunit
MRSISIGSGIFLWVSGSSIFLVMSLNTLSEALSKIIVLTGGSLMTDGRVTQNL